MRYKPETERAVKAVRDWQRGPFHDLTCGIDSRHTSLVPRVLVERIDDVEAERVILVCVQPGCTYTQGWIPDVVLKYRAAAER